MEHTILLKFLYINLLVRDAGKETQKYQIIYINSLANIIKHLLNSWQSFRKLIYNIKASINKILSRNLCSVRDGDMGGGPSHIYKKKFHIMPWT